jgi:hypothetical protein
MAILLAGCGDDGGAPVARPRQPTTPITAARAITYATAVNLRAADVPGLASFSTEHNVPAPTRLDLAFTHCFGGVSPGRALANAVSPEFSPPGGPASQAQFEESRVQVWPTSDLAARNYGAYHSARGLACFRRYNEESRSRLNEHRRGSLEHGTPAVVTVPLRLPGVGQSYLRTKVVPLVRHGRLRIKVYHDVFTFVYGPAEVELEATGFSHPVPWPTEQRLLLLLLSRAKASNI